MVNPSFRVASRVAVALSLVAALVVGAGRTGEGQEKPGSKGEKPAAAKPAKRAKPDEGVKSRTDRLRRAAGELDRNRAAGKYAAFDGWQRELRAVADRVAPSVVIVGVGRAGRRSPFQAGAPGAGAGVIVAPGGYILTNHALVSRPGLDIIVLFHDGRRATAKLVGADPKSDVALIRVEDAPDAPIEIGDSSATRVGQFTLAFGNPFNLSDDAQPSVNFGIISSTFRVKGNPFYRGVGIQTTANLNPGSEGGPLVDSAGRLIGICGRIERTAETGHAVSYAVPINQITNVMAELRAGKPVPDGYLGFAVDEEGYVTYLSRGGSAGNAGLRVGDVVTHIDGKVLKSRTDVSRLVKDLPIGTKIELRVQRDGREFERIVAIERAPEGF
ncbi:MAG: trypsin-like peptidase domain-containing protein [Planctomycetes bacterium]|nr:trypsin-like peptidase domain-containing protein [Planctomycetota bacterium]